MKILLMSYAYPPSMGGIEVFSLLMRKAFLAAGHEVRVVTETPLRADSPADDSDILRRPDKKALYAAIDWADLCFVSGVSLRYQIPAQLRGKPLAITHHTWLHDINGNLDNVYRLKLFLTRYALNIAVSHALASHLPQPALVFHNPTPDSGLRLGLPFAARSRDLLFVGRLVSDKGVQVLLDAITKLRHRGHNVTATIAGDGDLLESLKSFTTASGLSDQVRFTGRMNHAQIQELMGNHKMLIVPSLWKEPYPLVTLEALSNGAIVLGSHMGGLPEGIGPCGLTFPMGDSDTLASQIQELLTNPGRAEQYRTAIPAHLAPFSVEQVSNRYLHAFELLHHYHAEKRLGRRKSIRRVLFELAQ